ncbi:MAG: 4-hydroxybutyrate CoA-transferase, partial [Halobacteriovoraceae bacterium]|nr:4-hydroxybutyrate CoA-transferase [Halobacteriovoraceae bacterium]
MLTTAKQLFNDLKDNAHIFLHSAACNPTILAELICEEAIQKGIKKLNFYHLHLDGEAVHLREKYRDFVEVNCFFVGANCRSALRSGQASYIPVFLSQIHELFINGTIELDYALIQTSQFDRHGYATLGPSVDISVSALHSAKKVIAMINPNMPKVFGEGVVHHSNINHFIEVSQELPAFNAKALSEID